MFYDVNANFNKISQKDHIIIFVSMFPSLWLKGRDHRRYLDYFLPELYIMNSSSTCKSDRPVHSVMPWSSAFHPP